MDVIIKKNINHQIKQKETALHLGVKNKPYHIMSHWITEKLCQMGLATMQGHIAVNKWKKLTSLTFTTVSHSPYSPDLVPSNLWVFPKLKETLKGENFSSYVKADAAVLTWIRHQPETLHQQNETINIVVPKCLAVHGGYVENKMSSCTCVLLKTKCLAGTN